MSPLKSSRPSQTEILYGIHPVTEAIKAGRRKISRIYVGKENVNKRIGKIAQKARKNDIAVESKSRKDLDKLTGSKNHQDIAALVSLLPTISINRFLDPESKQAQNSFILIIDSITDPQNLGAIVRTAVCMGVSAIILPKDRCAGPTPAACRASAGAMEHADICVVTNLANSIKELKKNNFWIVGLDHRAMLSVDGIDMKGPCALVIGGEDTGIRPLVEKQCDFLAMIPQQGHINSLNASVAAAMAVYEAMRQRRSDSEKPNSKKDMHP